jgi:hypothetical protein
VLQTIPVRILEKLQRSKAVAIPEVKGRTKSEKGSIAFLDTQIIEDIAQTRYPAVGPDEVVLRAC